MMANMLVHSLLRLFFFVSISASVIYIVLGIIEWLKSMGKPELIADARSKIKYGAIAGVLLVMCMLVWSVIG